MSNATSGPLTAKGHKTRDRIVAAAAALMVERGVASVSLDEVGRATSTSKSQMYHYFASKEDLIAAVVDRVGAEILEFQGGLLGRVETIEDVEAWAEAIMAHQRGGSCFSGCPLGTLASDLTGVGLHTELRFDRYFTAWETLLEEGLDRMREAGELRADADTHQLAMVVLAALQGGLLMAKATQDEDSLRLPLLGVIAYLRSLLIG